MKIGITYDTKEDYEDFDYNKYCDFASLTSISFLKTEFEKAGFEAQLIGSYKKLYELVSSHKLNVDYIYNTAEGINSRNRESIIPMFLEMNKIPYIGSDAYALSVSLNKYHSKILAKENDIPTPEAEIIYLYDTEDEIKEKIKKLKFPFIVKPNCEGSSMGVFLVNTVEDCLSKIRENQKNYSQEIICEEYIDGKEITVPIIGNGKDSKALGIIEFYRDDNKPISIFTSDDKHYTDIKCRKADIPEDIEYQLKEYSEKIHRLLGCRDVNRIDYRLSLNNKIYFLEMNPLPALDPDGSFVCAANIQGMTFPELLRKVVQNAIDRNS